jgi:hypothetical protein
MRRLADFPPFKPFSLGAMRRAVNDALCAPPRRRH